MLPKIEDTGKGLQFFISDYTIESILYTVAYNGLLDVTLNNTQYPAILNTAVLSTFVPELGLKYGFNKPARLRLWINQTLIPDLIISQEGLKYQGSFYLTIEVMPDLEVGYINALTMQVGTTLDTKLDIDQDLLVTIKIKELAVGLEKILFSDIGDIDVDKINRLLSRLLVIFESLINTLFQRGFDLGRWLPIPIILKDIVIFPADGYYNIQANPYFEEDDNIWERFTDFITQAHSLKS